MKIAIIGGGITGLTAAYFLSKNSDVTVFEKNSGLGGIAGCFKQKNWGWSLEKYYHHFFSSDADLMDLIESLNLENKIFFKKPITSVFVDNQIYRFDTIKDLLLFPHLSLKDKFLTGSTSLLMKVNPCWRPLEKITAFDFIKKLSGQKSFDSIWKPLLENKFGKYAPFVPASWFWTRIKKRSFKLGYFQGGTETLFTKLSEKIKEKNGKILLNQNVTKIINKENTFEILINRKKYSEEFDSVITTVSPKVFTSITNLPETERNKISKLESLGTVCLVLELKESFLKDGTYWLNINNAGFPFVAVVEHTNYIDKINYGGNHILYVGGYYPVNHQFFKLSKEQLFKKFEPFLKRINPLYNFELCLPDIASRLQAGTLNFELFSDTYTQPIPTLNYSYTTLPSITTSIPNLYWGSLHHVYPEDRGINYAIKLGKTLANKIINSKFEARNSDLEVRSVRWEAGNEGGSGKFLKSHFSLQYLASHFYPPTSNN